MILHPELQSNSFTKRLNGLKHRRSRTKRSIVVGLMLTSMVDMFSLLVIFLLQSFSNSPEVMAISKNLVLPSAVSASAPVDAPLLTVTNEQILLDQKPMGSPKEVFEAPQKFSHLLQELRTNWQSSHREQEFKGEIHLQADRDLNSAMISRFINVLNTQGYSAVHLAVVSGGNQTQAGVTR
jgi:biopolymer transport protein ExbD